MLAELEKDKPRQSVVYTAEKNPAAALEKTHMVFTQALNELVKTNEFSEEEISRFRELLEREYAKRKISYLIEEGLDEVFVLLDSSLNLAFGKGRRAHHHNAYTDLVFVDHSKTFSR
jgi:hypothetical protein